MASSDGVEPLDGPDRAARHEVGVLDEDGDGVGLMVATGLDHPAEVVGRDGPVVVVDEVELDAGVAARCTGLEAHDVLA